MVISVLITGRYRVSERFSMRPRRFDLIASNGKTTLAIKVVSHIDSVSEETAADLESVARPLQGSALIIGERARDTDSSVAPYTCVTVSMRSAFRRSTTSSSSRSRR